VECLLETFPALEVGKIFAESRIFLVGLKLRPSRLSFALFIFPNLVFESHFCSSKERGHSGIGDTPFTNSVTLLGKKFLNRLDSF